MIYLKNEEGVSLLEMVVVLALMIIAAGIVSTSVNNINYANLEGITERYQSDLRMVRENNMYSADKVYKIEWDKVDNNAVYTIYYSTNNWTDIYELEAVTVNADITVYKDSAITSNEIGTISDSDVSIEFDSSDGSVTSSGAGDYIFTSAVLGKTKTVTLVELTGRAFIDE